MQGFFIIAIITITMCYYKGIRVTRAQLIELLERDRMLEAIQRDWRDFPIIKPLIPGKDWDFENAKWGFAPYWVDSMAKLEEHRKKYPTLNATAEKLFESNMFIESAKHKRCLIPFSHFFEWRHFKPVGAKKENTYPYYISCASQAEDDFVFYFAGIYNEFIERSTGELITTYAIITTVANDLMQQIHNTKKRMPTILPKALAEEWLSDIPESRIKEIAAHQFDSDEMIAFPIAKDFRAIDDFTEFHYEELPGLL